MNNLPSLPFRRRHGDPADAPQLDALLDTADPTTASPTAGEPTPEWQSVSDVLRSAAAAAEPSELVGQAAMLAAFRRERDGVRRRRLQPIARCKTVLSTLLTGRIAVGVTAAVVTLTGAATAAYACVLPSPIQSFAHDTIGAPAHSTSGSAAVSALQAAHHERDRDAGRTAAGSASPSATPSSTPSVSATVSAAAARKAAASAAAKGFEQRFVVLHLCNEYAADKAAGKTLDAPELAVLVKAAGSTASITAYCAALPTVPVVCPTAVPTVTPTVTPTVSPTATPSDDRFRHEGPFCGLCPEVKHMTTTTTATATATPSTGSKGDGRFGCDDHGRIVNPRVIPLPTINHDDMLSPDPGHSANRSLNGWDRR